MTTGVIDNPAIHDVPLEEPSTMHLVELLLKDESRVDELNRAPEHQRELLPRFLFIAQAGYLAYSLIMLLVINLAPASSDAGRASACCSPITSASCWRPACACRASTSTACSQEYGSPGCRS